MKIYITFIVAAAIALILMLSSLFKIEEGRQVVITQFGKPVRIVTDPGLQYKIPFIQEVRPVDRRILSWDGSPTQIPTQEKTYIWVDTTARWKIIDPLKFIQTVQDERGARPRLDAILDSSTRDIISKNRLVEAVRNSNDILDEIKAMKERRKERIEDEDLAEIDIVLSEVEEVVGEIEEIQFGRERLSTLILERAEKELNDLGIQLVDVQIRRIEYVNEIKKKVYNRMISERLRIAEKIRSNGKGEKAKIQGKTQRELQNIESAAYRRVQEIKGRAEAKAITTYANAYKQDPRFFELIRTLDAYDKALREDTEFILSSDSAFLRIFQRGL